MRRGSGNGAPQVVPAAVRQPRAVPHDDHSRGCARCRPMHPWRHPVAHPPSLASSHAEFPCTMAGPPCQRRRSERIQIAEVPSCHQGEISGQPENKQKAGGSDPKPGVPPADAGTAGKPDAFRRVQTSPARTDLIAAKSGSSPGLSWASAYWTTPSLSMTKAERFGTPAWPRFLSGRKLS